VTHPCSWNLTTKGFLLRPIPPPSEVLLGETVGCFRLGIILTPNLRMSAIGDKLGPTAKLPENDGLGLRVVRSGGLAGVRVPWAQRAVRIDVRRSRMKNG